MTTRFDTEMWICDTQSSILAFGGKEAKAPPPPDYTPIAQADVAAAQAQTQLGKDQLDWAKNQFSTVWPYAQQYLTSQTAATTAEQEAAREAQGFYKDTYQPIEKQFATEASSYASPENTEQRAGMAEADVATTFAASRDTAIKNLEGFGIDPSQTRFQALDANSRISEAAAAAAAANQSRVNTRLTGMSLENSAINIGRGYPSAIATTLNAGTNAGASGISEADNTTATGANTMGTPTSYFGGANAARAGATSALDTGFRNAATLLRSATRSRLTTLRA